MKSKKIITILSFVILFGCLTHIVSGITSKTFFIKAVGKGTVKLENYDEAFKSKMLLVAAVNPNSDGVFEGTAGIVMRYVLPDGTKITCIIRNIAVSGVIDSDGILQEFKFETDGWPEDFPLTKIKNKVYGALSTSIIAHEATHIVDFRLSFSMVERSKLPHIIGLV